VHRPAEYSVGDEALLYDIISVKANGVDGTITINHHHSYTIQNSAFRGNQMKTERISYLKQGLGTAFIDYDIKSNLAYKPQFISNNFREGQKVLSSLESELQSCDEFCISVAFITMSGITPLLQTLKDLEKRNIPGRILTTDYLTFSQPEALKRLAGLSNVELRMYRTGGAQANGTKIIYNET
jgi:HKD family nuclease